MGSIVVEIIITIKSANTSKKNSINILLSPQLPLKDFRKKDMYQPQQY
jgi:hypothetical protein